MDDEKIYVYKGDYDYFLEQKVLRQEVQQSELQKDKNIFQKRTGMDAQATEGTNHEIKMQAGCFCRY